MNTILSSLQSGLMDKVTVYPNPFQSRLSLELSSQENKTVIISMLNSQERIIKMFSWYVKAGTNKTDMDELGNLPAGSYHIYIKATDGEPISNPIELIKG